ncbi:MAG: hypothetical protein WC043_05900 [Pseudobdellovibrionaceae bacterium]
MFFVSPRCVSGDGVRLAPSFDKARDLGDLREPQSPASIDFVAPSSVSLPFWGPRVWSVSEVGQGFSLDDDFLSLRPVIQAGLDIYFARAASPEKARCTVMTEKVIVPPSRCARPDFTSEIHLDDLSSWFFDSRDIAPVRWGTYVMWSDDLSAEFFLSGLDVAGVQSAEEMSARVSSMPRTNIRQFAPGTVSLHTGASAHASVNNTRSETVTRQWCLITFHQ